MSVVTIDSLAFLARLFLECENNIHETVKILSELRFVIQSEKSVLISRQQTEFLGFLLDSQSVDFPIERIQKVWDVVSKILSQVSTTIQELAKILGILVSAFPAVDSDQRTNYGSQSPEFQTCV